MKYNKWCYCAIMPFIFKRATQWFLKKCVNESGL